MLLPWFLGNKRIDFEEFLSIFLKAKKNSRNVSVEEFIDTLNVFDKDNAGKVSSGELRHVLTALGKKGDIGFKASLHMHTIFCAIATFSASVY